MTSLGAAGRYDVEVLRDSERGLPGAAQVGGDQADVASGGDAGAQGRADGLSIGQASVGQVGVELAADQAIDVVGGLRVGDDVDRARHNYALRWRREVAHRTYSGTAVSSRSWSAAAGPMRLCMPVIVGGGARPSAQPHTRCGMTGRA